MLYGRGESTDAQIPPWEYRREAGTYWQRQRSWLHDLAFRPCATDPVTFHPSSTRPSKKEIFSIIIINIIIVIIYVVMVAVV